ncbi:hypothetical protein SASPL_149981 [Salvia splendens]|uniref:Uncharacterized protein n=1 Tax=Salvia splendens TaxID=180675 RepID=A0A8X8W5F1_SALSN|nr:hypothetical protein SASPL_149981 [Salvia splendens]
MGNKRHILSIYNAMKSREEEELVMKKECKAVHVVEVQKAQEIESTFGDFSLPQWMFGSCGGSTSKEETTSNPKVKVKKTKAENLSKVETEISDGALKILGGRRDWLYHMLPRLTENPTPPFMA